MAAHQNGGSQAGRTAVAGDGSSDADRRVGGRAGRSQEEEQRSRKARKRKQPRRVGRPAKPLHKPRGREQSCLVRGQQSIQAAVIRAEALPQGYVVSEPWPRHTYRPRKPTGKRGTKSQKREANRRYKQRRRARGDEADKQQVRESVQERRTRQRQAQQANAANREAEQKKEQATERRRLQQERAQERRHRRCSATRCKRNKPASVNSVCKAKKKTSDYASNAVFGMKRSNESVPPACSIKSNILHTLLLCPPPLHRLRQEYCPLSRFSRSLQCHLSLYLPVKMRDPSPREPFFLFIHMIMLLRRERHTAYSEGEIRYPLFVGVFGYPSQAQNFLVCLLPLAKICCSLCGLMYWLL